MTVTLYVTRGLPGSGKTTRARIWVAMNPDCRSRVNRDDLRRMMHDGRLGTAQAEEAVTVAQLSAVQVLLRSGRDVVVDDTNLDPEHLARLEALAKAAGCAFVVWDMTNVDVETCVSRDLHRTGSEYVGATVIRRMHESWRGSLHR